MLMKLLLLWQHWGVGSPVEGAEVDVIGLLLGAGIVSSLLGTKKWVSRGQSLPVLSAQCSLSRAFLFSRGGGQRGAPFPFGFPFQVGRLS
jgi:hypothetical protein